MDPDRLCSLHDEDDGANANDGADNRNSNVISWIVDTKKELTLKRAAAAGFHGVPLFCLFGFE